MSLGPRQKGRRAEGQKGRRAEGQKGRRAEGQKGRRAEGQKGRRAEGQKGRRAEGQKGRAEGQKGRRAEGQKGRMAKRAQQVCSFNTANRPEPEVDLGQSDGFKKHPQQHARKFIITKSIWLQQYSRGIQNYTTICLFFV